MNQQFIISANSPTWPVDPELAAAREEIKRLKSDLASIKGRVTNQLGMIMDISAERNEARQQLAATQTDATEDYEWIRTACNEFMHSPNVNEEDDDQCFLRVVQEHYDAAKKTIAPQQPCKKCEGFVEQIQSMQQTEAEHLDRLQLLASKNRGECWAWIGDGSDHLESLTCPVLIPAKNLMELMSPAPPAEPGKRYAGWAWRVSGCAGWEFGESKPHPMCPAAVLYVQQPASEKGDEPK